MSTILHRNLECQVHESRQIGSGQTRDGNSEHRHSRNQQNGLEWVNLTQMTIISTTVGKNPYKKWCSHYSQQKSPRCSTWMQSQKRQNDLCSFPRQTIQYHSKANHSISQ